MFSLNWAHSGFRFRTVTCGFTRPSPELLESEPRLPALFLPRPRTPRSNAHPARAGTTSSAAWHNCDVPAAPPQSLASSLNVPSSTHQRLAVAQRVQRLHRPITRQQPTRLLNQARGKHRRATLVQPVIEGLPRRIQPDAQQSKPGQRIASHHFRHRLSRRQAHLDRANQLGRVVRVNPLCRRRIQPLQQLGATTHSRGVLRVRPTGPAAPPAAPARQTAPPSAPADTAPFPRSQSAGCSRTAISLSRSRARLLYSPAVNGSSGSATSIRWCGTRARSSRVGFAVPSSMPRYTATESQLTISPPNRSASSSDSAVFPLPVGPRRITARGSRR